MKKPCLSIPLGAMKAKTNLPLYVEAKGLIHKKQKSELKKASEPHVSPWVILRSVAVTCKYGENTAVPTADLTHTLRRGQVIAIGPEAHMFVVPRTGIFTPKSLPLDAKWAYKSQEGLKLKIRRKDAQRAYLDMKGAVRMLGFKDGLRDDRVFVDSQTQWGIAEKLEEEPPLCSSAGIQTNLSGSHILDFIDGTAGSGAWQVKEMAGIQKEEEEEEPKQEE